ncbi:UNVERIFIED_CONTAM: hypothetical protein HDU68_011564 [Siphonaria sp. JEL0065]|nr:hypothetical protein HDU68_011564 [Siphonaria sp. JEL0065]
MADAAAVESSAIADKIEQQVPETVDSGLTIVEEGSADFPWLVERLANNVGFTSLSLSNANLSTDDVIAVAQALEVNTTLETLELEGNEIGSNGLLALAEAIAINKTLRELKIGHQKEAASNVAEKALAKAMTENFSLIVLDVNISDEGCRTSIQEALARNNTNYVPRRSSRSSATSRNRASKRSIGRKMSEQPTQEEINQIVEELTLEQKEELAEKIGELDPQNLQALFDLIRSSMPQLPEDEVELDIETLDNQTLWNMLEFVNRVIESEEGEEEFEEDDTEEGGLDVSWLVDQLQANAGIMTLQLSDAMLTTENVIQVAESLHENTILECLDLEGNEIQAEGIYALAKLITVNKTMKELRIGNQLFSFGIEAEKALAKAMSFNYRMTILTINLEDESSRNLIDKCLERNKAGFVPPRNANSPGPVVPPTAPVVKRKSSIENWKSVKNMVWKFEGGESDAAAVTERRRTKVTVVNKGGRVTLEETVVNVGRNSPASTDLRSTLVKLDEMLDQFQTEDEASALSEAKTSDTQDANCDADTTMINTSTATSLVGEEMSDYPKLSMDETATFIGSVSTTPEIAQEIPQILGGLSLQPFNDPKPTPVPVALTPDLEELLVVESHCNGPDSMVAETGVPSTLTIESEHSLRERSPAIEKEPVLLTVSESLVEADAVATKSELQDALVDQSATKEILTYTNDQEDEMCIVSDPISPTIKVAATSNTRHDSATDLLPASVEKSIRYESTVAPIYEEDEVEELVTAFTKESIPPPVAEASVDSRTTKEPHTSSLSETVLLLLAAILTFLFLPLSTLLFFPLVVLLRRPTSGTA